MVIGAQKAGTTALFDHLRDDPGLNLSKVKEAHFFDNETVDWAAPDYGRYHARYDMNRPGLKGEATPIYIYWPNALERIRAYNPAMRLIVMLRDPVARAWSHWRMEYARGAENKPFAWCVREGRRRLFESEPWGFHREFSYVERGFYGEQLERLFSLFPKEQVLILKAEDLRREPGEVLARVQRFLDLTPGAAPAPRESHVGREMDYGAEITSEDTAFLRGLYARDAARLWELAGVGFD